MHGSNSPTRRRLLAGAGLSVLGLFLRACGISSAGPTRTPAAPQTPFGSPQSGSPVANQATSTPTRILQNENAEGFYVRYYRPFDAPDRNAWRLEVDGLVERPVVLDYPAVAALPTVSQTSRMKCVECWSAKARWEGFEYASLAALVRPTPAATHVRFECADAYYEYLSIAELARPRVLFVTRMNDQPLPEQYGAPLRMIVPWLYGYKGAKAITRLSFVDKGGAGYWSTVGPYTVDGAILPGFDHPLDVSGGARQMQGGEITEY